MRKLTILAVLGTALLGLASLPAPAAAFPAAGLANANPSITHSVRYRHRKVCTVRKIVKRDRFGRRHVRTVRVCRR
jgi:hypothetical protein